MVAGHNNPPDMTETASETMRDLSAWLSEHPVIQSEEDAKEAKVFIDRGKLCLKDLDDERDGKVRPLNDKVKEINAHYRPAKESLSSVVGLLSVRVTQFITTERERREKIARDAALRAAEAESRAREAERVEQDAIASADMGELGVDVGAAIQTASSAFREFERSAKTAAIAEKETHVKITGGFTRALSLRTKETLSVTDGELALRSIGLTDDIRDAIIKSARAYRKLNGRLPEGVEAQTTEGI